MLKKIRKDLGIKKGLARPNRTRNTSVYEAMSTVYGARDAFRQLLQQDRRPDGSCSTINSAIAAILDDDNFFVQLKLGLALLQPFAMSLTMIQASAVAQSKAV